LETVVLALTKLLEARFGSEPNVLDAAGRVAGLRMISVGQESYCWE